MESSGKEESERIVRKLRTALRLLGFTNREIERRLGYTPSYLSRLFSGQIELRFEHIVDIARAMGLSADEFFAFAYPPRSDPPGEAARQLAQILEDIKPSTPSRFDQPTSDLILQELQQAIKLTMDKLLAQSPQRAGRRRGGEE
jgi:transcriptional regulator with XRE-family HTH domain